jgi:acetyltransferase-like isoleucine patch superfamily enzyme
MPNLRAIQAAVGRLGLLEAGVTFSDRWINRLRGEVKTLGTPHRGTMTFGPASYVIGRRHIEIHGEFVCGRGCRIEAVTIHQSTLYQPSLTLGENVALSDYVHIACALRIELGSGVLVGSQVLITDHNHGTYRGVAPSQPGTPPNQRPLHGAPVIIGHNVWIGDKVTILPGTTLGNGCVVGANSVVQGHFGSGTLLAGQPARALRVFDPVQGQWKRAHD